MRRFIRLGLIGIALILVVLQLVPNELPEPGPAPATDLLGTGQVPETIASLLRTSCYDCHSMETRYPWYSKIAPSSWLLAKDVREAREELNFSDWTALPTRKKIKNLENIKDEVGKGDMPLPAYLFIHWDAKLTDEQRKQLVDWANTFQDQILSEPEPEEDDEDES